MAPVEITLAIIALGWSALILAFVVAWSRFMGHVSRKERELVEVAPSATPATYQTAA